MAPNSNIQAIFNSLGALVQDTHVIYTSGRHGHTYVNKDTIYTNTAVTSDLCHRMATNALGLSVETVIGPTIGAVILSQWTAYHLQQLEGAQIASVFAEKSDLGFAIRRGYDQLVQGRRVLVVEDVVTTGGSLKKVIEEVRRIGGTVVAALALCNRGGVSASALGVDRFEALLDIALETWAPEECPLCKKQIPINRQLGKGAKAGI